MIFILACDAVDATAYASKVLGLKARTMLAECAAITSADQLPRHFSPGDTIRCTAAFEELLAEKDDWGTPEWSLRTASAMDRSKATFIATTVRMRGGTVLPAFDVPERLDRESIERWLAEG